MFHAKHCQGRVWKGLTVVWRGLDGAESNLPPPLGLQFQRAVLDMRQHMAGEQIGFLRVGVA